MGKHQLGILLAVLILMAIATIFVVNYMSAAVGKWIAGAFLIIIMGIIIAVNRKK